MVQIIDVLTGMVAIGNEKTILNVSAIGSCVVVSAYSRDKKIGGLAHIMLPGEALNNNSFEKSKYANNALEEMFNKMSSLGVDIKDIEICLIGGANVLMDSDDIIGKGNINSINEFLRKRQLKVQAQAIGGTERRSVSFDVGKGIIAYTEGDSEKMILQLSL